MPPRVVASRGTEHFRLLAGEDGILEWAGVAALAVAAWALFSAAARTAGRTRLVFVEAHNGQGEATLHNLSGFLDLSFIGIVATSIVLAVLIVVAWEPLGNVPVTVVWWFMVPAIYAGYRVAAGTVPYYVARMSEAGELVFSIGLARISLSARLVRSNPCTN
jgi:hypothetical protein